MPCTCTPSSQTLAGIHQGIESLEKASFPTYTCSSPCYHIGLLLYMCTHSHSLAAPCNSTVPGSLVPGLALLCLGSLVAMETLRPPLPLPSSLIHPLIPVCSNEIETLLRSSDSVLKELLRLFQRKEIIIGNNKARSRKFIFLARVYTRLNFEEY